MALDVMVMPLWRFKSGDVTSPIEEALGIKPEIIDLSEPMPWRPPWYLRLMEKIGLIEFADDEREPTAAELRAQAMAEVESLAATVSKESGCQVRWPDEGATQYNRQFHGVSILKAFAAWADHQDALPVFETPPPGNDYWKHPVWELPKPPAPQFPLLLGHNLHAGYFLPVEFPGCHKTEPYLAFGRWEAFHDVASTPAVRRELEKMLAILEGMPPAAISDQTTPLGSARAWARELHKVCSLSMEHQLPVIFYG